MNKKVWLTYFLPIVIVAIVIAIVYSMVTNKPKAYNRAKGENVEVVEVSTLEFTDYQILVESYGNIQSATSGNLVAQVSGLVTQVADNFESGRAFKKGEVLLQIDDRDFQIDVTIARSEFADAKLALDEEKARSEQALKDWMKINPEREAGSLVLRRPQLASAEARIDAAQARLDKAQLSLSRAKVIAPYDGYIIEKRADRGQLINSNTPVATIFASDSLEVRLPVPGNKIQFLELSSDELTSAQSNASQIKLDADFGSINKTWIATLDRTDSVIDPTTRQWFVTAKLPAELLVKEPLLKVGQFVSAQIEGKLLQNVVQIPSKLISQNSEVFIFEQGVLRRQKVAVLWQSDEMSVIDPKASTPELEEGQQLVTTVLNFVADGAKARLKDAKPKKGNRAEKAQ